MAFRFSGLFSVRIRIWPQFSQRLLVTSMSGFGFDLEGGGMGSLGLMGEFSMRLWERQVGK